MTDHRVQDRNGQVVRIEATPKPIAIDTARTAVLVVDTQNDFGAQGGMFDRAGIDISMIRGAIGPTAGKKPTMTLDTVPYTANAHPMRGRDGASHRDNGRLDVKVSSSGTPGFGTTPEGNHSGPATLVRPRRRMMMSAVSSIPHLAPRACHRRRRRSLQPSPARGLQRRADGSVRRCPGLRQRPGRSGRRQSHSPLPYQ
jgi:hypothetical protein